MPVEFGVLLPTREAVMSGRPETAPMLAMAERAEAAGFDSVWIGDSLIAQAAPRAAHPAGRRRRAHAARAPRHGRLLPARATPSCSPRSWRRSTASPRGASSSASASPPTPPIRKEFAAVGAPWDRRVGRYLETLEICRALWTRDGVSFSGKHFTLENVTMEPKPHRPGGPPSGSAAAARRRSRRREVRRVVPYGPQRGVLRRTLPAHPGGSPRGRPRARRRDGRGVRHARARREPGRRREAPARLPREVLWGAGARDHGPPGHLRRADRRLRRVAPALDRRRRPPHLPALRRRRPARQVDEAASRLLPRLKRG